MMLAMQRRLKLRFLAVMLLTLVAACGAEDEPAEVVTQFEPPAWVSRLDGAGGTTDDTDDGGGEVAAYGLQVVIPGVAEPLVVPEGNVVINENLLSRNLFAPGLSADGSRQVSLTITLLAAATPPAEMDFQLGPPQAADEATLFYGESSTSSANNITGVTSGKLTLERWSDTRVDGTFSAEIFLADGTARSLQGGTIRIRR